MQWNKAQMDLIRDVEMRANPDHPELNDWVQGIWEGGPENYAGDYEYELLALSPVSERAEMAYALGVQYGLRGPHKPAIIQTPATGYELELIQSMLTRVMELYSMPDQVRDTLSQASDRIMEATVAHFPVAD